MFAQTVSPSRNPPCANGNNHERLRIASESSVRSSSTPTLRYTVPAANIAPRSSSTVPVIPVIVDISPKPIDVAEPLITNSEIAVTSPRYITEPAARILPAPDAVDASAYILSPTLTEN